MKFMKKMFASVFVVAVVFSCVSTINAHAATNDNYDYKFQIGRWAGNGSVEKARERTTEYYNNAWKVRLDTSGEGTGTITRFWLELKSGTNVTGAIQAKQGGAEQYKIAYPEAQKKWVYLTGENNNYNNSTYYVTGIWDEETGIMIQ